MDLVHFRKLSELTLGEHQGVSVAHRSGDDFSDDDQVVTADVDGMLFALETRKAVFDQRYTVLTFLPLNAVEIIAISGKQLTIIDLRLRQHVYGEMFRGLKGGASL